MQLQTGIFTRGRSLFAALLIVVLAAGLINSIGWAQDATPDVDTLDQICATLEASPDASPEIGTPEIGTPEIGTPEAGTPEADVSVAGTDTEAGTPQTDMTMDASPGAELEAELCGTPTS